MKLIMKRNNSKFEQVFQSKVLMLQKIKQLESQGFTIVEIIEDVPHVYFPNPLVH
jgi:hypothetical protein